MKTIILFGLVLGALSAAGKVYIAEVGGKVTLQCGVTSIKSRLEWKHDNLRILVFETNGFINKGSSEIKMRAKKSKDTDIEISKIMEGDSGKFTCVVGRSSHEHHLIVVSVSAPSGPLKVGADATLECKANSGGSGLSQLEVKWRKPDGSVQTESKVELKSVALTDKGTWQCLVSCQEEKFTKTVTINVEEPVPEPTTPTLVNPKNPNSGNGNDSSGGPEDPMMLLGLVWWIWVAIGAGSLVVIILVIVIIVMHKRNKRKKKKFLRMKKAQLSQKPKKYCQCVRQTAAAKPQQGRRREKPSALPLQPLLQE
ncbi:PREDICTED: T-cell surface glycoprotein CD4-like [Poecilia mexicana]|uniref:T-cell surface glycoprotein CD4-like n=1 Tax=Poecilia mexicana TaxID=48701 RepID=UPI00072DE7E4|nr:PREDICTED: T-cell surface glycoprotein CD4-like [Poecilia mexicana]